MAKKNTTGRSCSMCGRPESEVGALITGVDGAICSQCVEMAYDIVQEFSKKTDSEDLKFKNGAPPKPTEIKQFLDQYVIGQDEAKKFLSVAVYNHYKRLTQRDHELRPFLLLYDFDILLLQQLQSDVFELVFLYFAATGHWKFVDEENVFRNFEARNLSLAKIADILFK